MITMMLLFLALCCGVFYLGFGILWLVALIAVKAVMLGVSLIFSLGAWAVAAAVLAIVLLFKFASLMMLMIPVAAGLFVLWIVLQLFGGGSRRATPTYYSREHRGEASWRGAMAREAAMERLNAMLGRLEGRMAALETEMGRRRGRW